MSKKNDECECCGQKLPSKKKHKLEIYIVTRSKIKFDVLRDKTNITIDGVGEFFEFDDWGSDKPREAIIWCDVCDEDLYEIEDLKAHGVAKDWAKANGWDMYDGSHPY